MPAPVVCDLDGVVWLGDEPIPGATEAVARLRGAGHPVCFITNNSFVPVTDVEAKLAAHGIDAGGEVFTSAQAAATLVSSGERVLVCGGPGLRQAMTDRGAVLVDGTAGADVVAVGLDPAFDYERLGMAASAVRAGARFVASNDDTTYPTPAGLVPGAGALVSAVAAASGVAAVVAGKPYPPMVDLVRGSVGAGGVVVGDRPDTDGRFARALGYRFALVLSGVTRPGDLPVEPEPDLVAADLAGIATQLVGR